MADDLYIQRPNHRLLVKQNVGLALESEIMGASRFLDKAVLLTMACISGVKYRAERESS